MTDDLPFDYPDTAPATGAGVARKCRHPRDRRTLTDYMAADSRVIEHRYQCGSCGHIFDPARQAMGRRANRRGRRIQKQAMERAGLTNLPGNIPGLDGTHSMFRGESKSGGRFPELLWRWLKAIPAAPGQVPILVVSDAPGPGHKRRQVVVLELADWRLLHGEDAA